MRKIALLTLLCTVLSLTCVLAEEVTLRFSWWGGAERHEATTAAVRAFEAANPGIKIKAEYMGWDGYLERLTTQIGAGSEPDLMQVDWAWLAMFSKDGNGFYDLNRLANLIRLGEWGRTWLDSGTVQGKLNALPVSLSAQIVVWNKTMWDKAGLPLPKTWDDLIAAGKIFKDKLGAEYYPIDLDWHEIMLLTHSYIFQKTGRQYLDPQKPEVALSLEELADWMRFYRALVDSKALTDLSVRTAIGGDSQRPIHEFMEWVDGRWAGTMTWDAFLSVRMGTADRAKFDYVVGDFLAMPGAKVSGRLGRPSMLFAISRNAKHPEAAAALLDFLLCTEEAAKILKSTRGVFITKTGYETVLREGLIAPLNQSALDQIRASDSYTPNPYFEHARVKELLRQVIEGVGFGKLTPEQAAEQLMTEGNRIVTRLAR